MIMAPACLPPALHILKNIAKNAILQSDAGDIQFSISGHFVSRHTMGLLLFLKKSAIS